MQREHVAFDMDDVILDFCGGLAAAVKKEYDVDILITEWDLHKVLDPIIGYSWWNWMKARDWLWPNFPAINGAIGGLDKLHSAGYYIEIVTSKPDWAHYAVSRWLGKWRPWYDRVTIVDMDTRKVDVTDAGVLIDDKWENIQEFVDEGRQGLLFDRTHNQLTHLKHPPGDVIRVFGWYEIPDALALLKENRDEPTVQRA